MHGRDAHATKTMTELEDKPVQYRKHLQWGEHDPHRRQNTPLGMWAWLWQRISALAIGPRANSLNVACRSQPVP